MNLLKEINYFINSRMPQKNTDARIDGKICVITGATSGVGYEAAKQLARGGAYLVLVCRNEQKAHKVQMELMREYDAKSDIVLVDFRILSDVRHIIEEISKKYPIINVLINNVGIFNTRRLLTPDGNEMVFQVVHLASFLITKLLIKNLKAGAPSHILDINSESHRFGGLDLHDLNWLARPYFGIYAYGAAKTAQLLTVWEFDRRLKRSRVTINAMHPGGLRTNIGMNNGLLFRSFNKYFLWRFLKDPVDSGKDIYYLVAAPEMENVSGKFFKDTIEEKPAKHAINKELREKIWEISEKLTNTSHMIV